jgi:type IV fimbrial biogenesis protein FimT
MKRRLQHGFTLSELLTTVSVIGISLALVAPSFEAVTSNNRRATAVNQLVNSLHVARSEAITRNSRVTLCPSTNGESCTGGSAWADGWVVFADLDGDQVLDADDTVLASVPRQSRLTISSTEFSGVLSYRPNGRVMGETPNDNSGEFVFCDHRGAKFARVLILNNTGEPRVSDKTAAGADPECGGGA